ncbi:T9SS type B sorting domain-containing protein [Bergeyella sp. RCAD1439]|uniref:T9SS type B sorting domain-containing protein n=1 Tax=Bergeyella anatis TaxID=3113737 RepID=UPI002E16DB3E|nr:T9SS type B sorting domain-containing protein [Bergeyella sp. RCAD1439]
MIATEDHTQVKLFGQEISLNRGESYLLGGAPMDNSRIGSEIIANKPIAVTNGNYNGQYVDTFSGSDILMDQNIPVERLGREFILMSGNGDIDSGMESALLIATENNTQIFFNDAPSPYATLNKGEYLLLPSSAFIVKNNTPTIAYIRASANISVFQLLSGSGSLAAGGFNYIPPLNCYLPKIIDEIAFIDENPGYIILNRTEQYITHHHTKLNIISQKGATVNMSINGNPPTLLNGVYGPYNVPGSEEWVTFSVPNISGTVTITSNRAVTAGIAAGSEHIGYGGYFAGASSMPIITKTGECLPGITLEVDDTFEAYQWQKLNPETNTFEDLPSANTYRYTPTQVGEFRCVLGTSSCGKINSPAFKVLSCTTNSSTQYALCSPLTITPTFTQSGQSPNASSFKVIESPLRGSLSFDQGRITYTPNADAPPGTSDRFSYYLEGEDRYPDSEIFVVNLALENIALKNATLKSCLTGDTAIFNLLEAEINSDSSLSVDYFENLEDAQTKNLEKKIKTPERYTTSLAKVYALAQKGTFCHSIAEITLEKYLSPQADASGFDGSFCDDDFDGKATVRFSDITPSIVPNANAFQVNYYDALNPSVKLDDLFEFSKPTEIIVEVISPNGCPPAQTRFTLTFKERLPLKNVEPITLCDNNRSGQIHIRLGDYAENFHDHLLPTFYASLDHAQKKINPIPEDQPLTGNQSFFLRFESNDYCPQIGVLSFILKQPNPSSSLKNTTICPQSLTSLDAGDGFDAYLWSNGSTEPVLHNVPVGNYYVDLFSNGCVFRQYVDVLPAETPKISHVDVDGQSVTLHPQGGTPPYLFSINGKDWSENPVFHQVQRGTHTAFLKDANQCLIAEKEFIILNLINVITPNGDGKNDRLDYADLKIKKDVSIQIFDRFGKLIAQIKNNPLHWDGTSAGRPVPTDTYWYLIQWTEPETLEQKKFSGWVLVKNR